MAEFTIEMPHVGESVTEAVVGKWLVSPGDTVRKYDPLVEVITDKVNMEVPAPQDGQISVLLVGEGDTVQMGAPIATMAVAGDEVPESVEPPATSESPRIQSANRVGSMIVGANVGPTGGEFTDTSLQEDAPVDRPQSSVSTPQRRPARAARGAGNRVSPVVRRIAARHGIDVSLISGTGSAGRVTKRDIEAYIASKQTTAPTSQQRVSELIEPTPIRRIIAENMARSFREIPHAWGAVEVDVSAVVAYRQASIDDIQQATGERLTYLPIILNQVAQSLRDNPLLNSSWQDGKIELKGAVNIGVAVASEQGLVVPVVKDTDGLSLEDTVVTMARLVDAARSGTLRLEDVQDGTFTLNNTGALGSVWGGAIINYPQAAILTTEAIVRRPVVVDMPDGSEGISIRAMMNMCLSFDHRIIDGAEAMKFLNDVKTRLESISPDMRS